MGGGDGVGTVVGEGNLVMLKKVGSKYKTGIEKDGKKVDSQVDNSEVLKPNNKSDGVKSKVQSVEEEVNVFNVSDLLSQQCALVSDSSKSKSSISEIVEQCEQWSVKEMVELFETVSGSGLPNFQGCRIEVPASKNLNMGVWRSRLASYEDRAVCDYLQYGFPLDFDKKIPIKLRRATEP